MTKENRLLYISRDICIAYLKHNRVPATELDVLFTKIYLALLECDISRINNSLHIGGFEGTSSVSSIYPLGSVLPDGIVSLIDGNVYKTLKRHLTAHGLTPETYRAKFGLSKNYPMVAPNYAAKRAAIARQIGLSRFPSSEASSSRTQDETTFLDRDQ
jgi:predicted transcriptional regulator